MASPASQMAGCGLSSHARLPGPWWTSAFMVVLMLRVVALLVASPSLTVVIDIFSKGIVKRFTSPRVFNIAHLQVSKLLAVR